MKQKTERLTRVAMVYLVVLLLAVTGCQSSAKKPAPKFPEKAVKVVVTHGPGSTTDMSTRLVTPFVEKQLGVPVVVENVEGAGGRIARSQVFKEQPDGYTLLATGWPSLQLGELLYKPPYKTSEFTYIYNFVGADYGVIYVAKDSPYRTFEDLVAASKQKEVVLAGSSLGAGDHLLSVLLRKKGNFQHKYVPFPAEQIVMAVLGKQVDAGLDSIGGVGTRTDVRILAIASSSKQRSPLLPEVPTLAELGYEGIEVCFRIGIVGPPGIPEDRVKVLEKAWEKALADEECKKAAEKAAVVLEPLDAKTFKDKSLQLLNDLQAVLPLMEEEIKKGGK